MTTTIGPTPSSPPRSVNFQRMLEFEKLSKMDRMKPSSFSSPPLRLPPGPGLPHHALPSVGRLQVPAPSPSPRRMISPSPDEAVFSDTNSTLGHLAAREDYANNYSLNGRNVMEKQDSAVRGRQDQWRPPLSPSPQKQVKFVAPQNDGGDGDDGNSEDDIDNRSQHSSICQSPSWEGYGQRKREKKEAERRKKEREQAEREAKMAKKRAGTRLSKASPQQQAFAVDLGTSSRPQLVSFPCSDLLRTQTRGADAPPPFAPSAGESVPAPAGLQPQTEGFLGGIKLARARETGLQTTFQDEGAPPRAPSAPDKPEKTHRRRLSSSLTRVFRSRSRSRSAEPASPVQTSSSQHTARRADGRPAREAMFPPSASRTPMLRRSEVSPPRSRSLLRMFRGREGKEPGHAASEDESTRPPRSDENTESVPVEARGRRTEGHMRRPRIPSTERAPAGIADQQRFSQADSDMKSERSESRRPRARRRSSITQEAKAVVLKLTGRRSSSTARSEPRPEPVTVDDDDGDDDSPVRQDTLYAFTELPVIAVGNDPLTVPYLASPYPSEEPKFGPQATSATSAADAPHELQLGPPALAQLEALPGGDSMPPSPRQQTERSHVAHPKDNAKRSPRPHNLSSKIYPVQGVSEVSSMSSAFDEPMDSPSLPSPGTTASTSGTRSVRGSAPRVNELHDLQPNPSGLSGSGSGPNGLSSYHPPGKVSEPNRSRLGSGASTPTPSTIQREFPLVQAKAKANARAPGTKTPGGGADQTHVPSTVGLELPAQNTATGNGGADYQPSRASRFQEESMHGATAPGPVHRDPPAPADGNAPLDAAAKTLRNGTRLVSQLTGRSQKRQGLKPPVSLVTGPRMSGSAPDATTGLSPEPYSPEPHPQGPAGPTSPTRREQQVIDNTLSPSGDKFSAASPGADLGGERKTPVQPGYLPTAGIMETHPTDINRDVDAKKRGGKREKLRKAPPQAVIERAKQSAEAPGEAKRARSGAAGASDTAKHKNPSLSQPSLLSARLAPPNGGLPAPPGRTSAPPTLADLIMLEKLGVGRGEAPPYPGRGNGARSPPPASGLRVSSQFPIRAMSVMSPPLPHRSGAGAKPASLPPSSFRGGHKHSASAAHRSGGTKLPVVNEGSVGANGLSAATSGPVAKVFVECCSCRFYIDLPSKLYECLAMPDAVVEDEARGVSGGITTLVKCPWCNHNMSTRCCAGYASVVYHTKRLH